MRLTECSFTKAHGRTDGLEGRPTTYKTIYNEIYEIYPKYINTPQSLLSFIPEE